MGYAPAVPLKLSRRVARFNRAVNNPIQRQYAWLLPPWVPGDRDWSNTAKFCKSFFEEVAPTLEKLSCDDRVFPEDCVIRFPRLHILPARRREQCSPLRLD